MNKKQIISSNLQALNDLVTKGKISLILKTAKFLQRIIEKLITQGNKYHKTDNADKQLHIRRNILKVLRNNTHLTQKIINLGYYYNNNNDRNSGYTRVLKKIGNNSRIIGRLSLVDFASYNSERINIPKNNQKTSSKKENI